MAAARPCESIAADRVYARDLSTAVPEFAKLPPDVPLGFAPTPGQRKIFSAAQISRLAKSSGAELASVPADVCFEWKMRELKADDVLPAMQKALGPRRVSIEIAEISRFPVPQGEITFADPPAGGSSTQAAPLLWRGSILYAPNRRFSIWPLRSGQQILAGQVRVEEWSGALAHVDELTAPEEAVGQALRFTISAGAVIRRGMLTKPPDIERGDVVKVRVTGLSSVVAIDAIAEERGVRGTFIFVKNQSSGKKFRARVDGKDAVSVVENGG
jgi:flagella basal body P-ring formation protein FlgA